MKYKVACCDDEINELNQLKNYFEMVTIQSDIILGVDYYTSGKILLEKYERESNPYDILILDIEMDEMSGLEIAEAIRRRKNRDTLIFFLTSYPQYMKQSFQFQAFQCLIKPISYETFRDELFRAFRYIKEDETNLLIFSVLNEDFVLHARDVVCLEKEKGMAMMRVTTTDDVISAKGNLNNLEERLLANHFIQVNRSCFVNMAHIRKFSGKDIVLSNGKIVTMSRRKVMEIKEKFTRFAVLGAN